jgi:hypothetical protein
MVAATTDKVEVLMVAALRATLERVTKVMTPATATLVVIMAPAAIPELALALLAQVARMEPVAAVAAIVPVVLVAVGAM